MSTQQTGWIRQHAAVLVIVAVAVVAAGWSSRSKASTGNTHSNRFGTQMLHEQAKPDTSGWQSADQNVQLAVAMDSGASRATSMQVDYPDRRTQPIQAINYIDYRIRIINRQIEDAKRNASSAKGSTGIMYVGIVNRLNQQALQLTILRSRCVAELQNLGQ